MTNITEEQALALLADTSELRKRMRDDKSVESKGTKALKDFLMDHDMIELINGEIGMAAKLQERQSSGTLNLRELARDHPDVLVQLALDGALKGDIKAIDDLPYAGDLVDYLLPGKSSYALVFKSQVTA